VLWRHCLSLPRHLFARASSTRRASTSSTANGGAKWLDLKLVTPQFKKGSVFGSGQWNWILHQIWFNMDAEQQLCP
jgi:hypothetical protein